MDHVPPLLPPDVEDARNAQELLARHQAGDHILRQPDLRHGRFFLASIGRVDIAMLLSTVIGISLVIASACVLNNCVDRDLDRKMTRTRDRVANLNSMLNFRNWHKQL
jgi:Na+(H+)/acetate symporter ActP